MRARCHVMLTSICQFLPKCLPVVLLLPLCVQYSVLLMALSKEKENAHWNELEVIALINYFYRHWSEVGGGETSA
jgi:hypothetical protein